MGIIQSFRTLSSKVIEDLQQQLSERQSREDLNTEDKHISDIELEKALEQLENVNAYLYALEALMEKIFEAKVSTEVELKFKEIAKELAPDPLNVDRLILNRLFHQTPDFPDKKNIN